MSSGSAAPKEVMNERLAELRDATLVSGENIVSQQMGDHGQGVVITDSRVMILKAGLTATGSINGQNVTAFKFDEIGVVNLRRGPMGAIIQIIGKQISPNSTVRPPENMAIFSGEQKVKKLEVLIEKLTSSAGITINRVEWIPDAIPDAPQSDTAIEQPPATVLTDADSEPILHSDQNDVESAAVPKKPRAPRKKPVQTIVEATAAENEAIEKTEPAVSKADDKTTPVQNSSVGEDKIIEPSVAKPESRVAEKPQIQAVQSESSKETEAPTSQRGVQRKSLAEEIFAELSGDEPEVPVAAVAKKVEIQKPQPVAVNNQPNIPVHTQPNISVARQSSEVKEVAPVTQAAVEYGPNPRLSSYMKKRKSRVGYIAAVIVLLGLLALAGIAIMGRNSLYPVARQDFSNSRKDMSVLRSRLQTINDYKKQLSETMVRSNIDAKNMEQALLARDAHAIRQTVSVASHEKVLKELHETKPPVGLSTAQSLLESAVTERKTVATAVSNALAGASIVDPGKSNMRLKAANNRIQKAFGDINSLEKSLNKQIRR